MHVLHMHLNRILARSYELVLLSYCNIISFLRFICIAIARGGGAITTRTSSTHASHGGRARAAAARHYQYCMMMHTY